MKKWLKVFIVLLLLIIAIYMVDNVDKIIKRDNVNNIDQNDDEIIKNKEDKLKENKKYNEEIEVVEKNPMEEALDEKKIFTNFKISDEVLKLALEYEKKKKEIKNKENELNSLNFEIDRIQNKKV